MDSDEAVRNGSESRKLPMAIKASAAHRLTDVVREILKRRSIDRLITADADLHEIGLSSLDMVGLMLSVEAEFDITIPEAEMTPRNFRSIAAIDALLAALTRPA